MRITSLITVAALAAALATPVLAQPPGGGGGRGMMGQLPDFATQDANKDGKVSKEEFTNALPEQARQSEQAKQFIDMFFGRRDANSDGFISKEESEAPMMGRGGGRGPGGGAPVAPAAPAPAAN